MMFHQIVWNLSLHHWKSGKMKMRGGLVTTAVMRISDLQILINDVVARQNCHIDSQLCHQWLKGKIILWLIEYLISLYAIFASPYGNIWP